MLIINQKLKKAQLIDFDDSSLLIRLDAKNAQQQPARVQYNETRLPPLHASASSLRPGDECEVMPEQQNDNEPNGWYSATVKMMKGEFFVVEYKNSSSKQHSDIVASDRIRAPNRNSTLRKDFLHKITFPVPDDLKDLYKNENPSKDFRKVCGAISVHYDEQGNTLSVIVIWKKKASKINRI